MEISGGIDAEYKYDQSTSPIYNTISLRERLEGKTSHNTIREFVGTKLS